MLLTLPRRTNSEPPALERSGASELQQFQLIETACGPKAERDLLFEVLSRSPGLTQSLTDPTEVHNYHNPLASVNAYKHRMHALRCEYVTLRLRNDDLETQVSELARHIRFLEATLEQMRASRGWKLVEKCSQWRRSARRWLQRLPGWPKSKPRERIA